MTKNDWVTTGELVKLLGVTPTTVRSMIARGEIQSVRIGYWNRIPKSEFNRLKQLINPTALQVPPSVQPVAGQP